MRQVELRSFVDYGSPAPSPVLLWLPLLLGFSTSLAIAALICPIPRPRPLGATEALYVSAVYLTVIVLTGTLALLLTAAFAARLGEQRNKSLRLTTRYVGVASLLGPLTVFYMRESFWVLPIAIMLALAVIRTVRHLHAATADPSMPADPQAASAVDVPVPLSVLWMVSAVVAVQIAFGSILGGLAQPASICVIAAIVFVSLRHRSQAHSGQPNSTRTWVLALHPIAMLSLSYLLILGGLTPYMLAIKVQTEDLRQEAENRTAQTKRPKFRARPQDLLPPPAANRFWNALLQESVAPQLADPSAKTTRPPSKAGVVDSAFTALNTVFGDGDGLPEPTPNAATRPRSVSIVSGDSYAGLILRPPAKELRRVIPPRPRRYSFQDVPPANQNRPSEPLTIPFTGVYWFYRAPERTLPADAIEAQGDPTAKSFRTTDFTPMAMEAQQSFDAPIPLDCCRAIQVVINNRDRRPNTVEVGLVLINTKQAGRPSLYLGKAPVTSSARVRRLQDPAATEEVLTFSIPLFTPITSFDEAILHFELNSPRRIWSARIAIDRFRLMPRGL